MKPYFVALSAAIMVSIGIAACGSGPAPAASTPSAPQPPSAWHQLDDGNSPYDYPSVAFMCNGPNGVYVSSFANAGATAGGSVFVVKDDPACTR